MEITNLQGNAPYDTIEVRTTERDTIHTRRYAEVSLSFPNTERERVIKYIENHYMLGMDAYSWFGYMEQMDKDGYRMFVIIAM